MSEVIKRLDVYTDGSYTKLEPGKVTGGLIVLQDNKPVVAQRCVSRIPSMVSMNNVGGELTAAIVGIGIAFELLSKLSAEDKGPCEIVVYHDYKGIKDFIAGNPRWNPKQPGAKMYVVAIDGLIAKHPNIKLKFVKVKAHTGVKWNDAADDIANGIIPAECASVALRELVFGQL